MLKRRKYSAEFKREAVTMANQPGISKTQIGRELGINPTMIARWARELGESGSKAFGSSARVVSSRPVGAWGCGPKSICEVGPKSGPAQGSDAWAGHRNTSLARRMGS